VAESEDAFMRSIVFRMVDWKSLSACDVDADAGVFVDVGAVLNAGCALFVVGGGGGRAGLIASPV